MMQNMTKTMNISRLIALAGSVITLVQILLLANDSNGICFNDGCEIVDSLTSVPPIFFNIGGFLFFQTVFWGIWLAGEQRARMQYVNLVLLAAIAVEGVLVSFQHFIAQTFCTYCLLILGFVVLLNFLGGLRHSITAGMVFLAVIMGFSSLQFSNRQTGLVEDLDRGSFAVLDGRKTEEKSYLFFSSTCKYCEKVIASLAEGNNCTIRFNPIDEINDFSLDKAKRVDNYATDVNRKFLNSLGIGQIPVFLSVEQSGFTIVKGESPIKTYLQENCTIPEVVSDAGSSSGFSSSTDLDFLPPLMDDSCSVNTDCDDPNLIPQTN